MKPYRNIAALLLLIFSQPLIAQGLGDNPLPPGSSAQPGDVLRPGHLGRQTGDLERIIHFYHDLLGTGIRGAREEPRPFWTSPGLIEFAATPEHAEFRAVILPIPGTAGGAEPDTEMAVEAIEFRNMERHQYVHALHDIGSSHLVLILRDLDATLARLKAAGVAILSAGGNPVAVPLIYGTGMTKRAVIVRDPDGYPVELVELTPPPPTTAPADSGILGARISITVRDLDAALQLYQDLIGPEFRYLAAPAYSGDAAYNDLRNTPGAEYRIGAGLIPGSPVVLEFIQYRNVAQRAITPILQDIGVAHVLFMVRGMEAILPRLRAADLHTLSKTGGPVFIAPRVPALFVTDPNGFFIEFMARLPE